MPFIIKGTKRDGSTVYYTAKSGETAVSTSRAYARPYTKGDEAARLAYAMNMGTAKHGITWEAVPHAG